MANISLIAVDVGNRRMKFGWFGRTFSDLELSCRLPEPESLFYLETHQPDWSRLDAWLDSLGTAAVGQSHSEAMPDLAHSAHQDSCQAAHTLPAVEGWAWWIGSVNRPAAARLVEWIGRRWSQAACKLLQWTDLPIPVEVQRPERVGIDRLLNALAVNRVRPSDRPAVVVDVGTAITVDWVSAEGAFAGGAILPGLEMSAKALHQLTDLLPEVALDELEEPPPALGKHTEAAIRSGLFWGAVGAIRELIRQLAQETAPPPLVVLTGGAGQALAPYLGPTVQYIPHLTLAGIALAALGPPLRLAPMKHGSSPTP